MTDSLHTARRMAIGASVLALVLTGCRILPPTPTEREAWSLGPELPKPFGELATVSVPRDDGGEQLVVLSGIAGWGRVVDDVFVFDSDARAWKAGPALPGPRHHASAAVLDGRVVLSGGAETLDGDPWQGATDVWQWKPGDDAWEALPPLPEARWGHRMVEYDGRLYVVGGFGESGTTLVYQPGEEQWREAAPIPEARDHLSVVVVEDRIWAIGGRAPESMARVDIYDPAEDEWTAGPALPDVTSGAAEGVIDGRIYIFGGEEPAFWGGGIFDRHWVLDTGEDDPQWRPASSPPLAVHGADGVVFENAMVIVGGAGRHGLLSITAWTEAFQVMDRP